MLFSHVREDGTATFHYPYHEAQSVHVTGSFHGWRTPGHALARGEHGFTGEVADLPAGDNHYKLIVDGHWVTDPLNLLRAPDGTGGENSLLHHGRERGSLQHLRFRSPALGEERGYVLYLPPGYAAPGVRFPVLYLLHGALDWEKSWIEKGDLGGAMDRLRAEGAIGDMIVVMPRDNGDLYRGDNRFADYLARDLVGHVDYEYRTLADPRHRALDGLSTGGFTSVMVGAWRTGVFGSIGSMSGCHDDRTFEAIRNHADRMRAAGQRYRVSLGLGEPHGDACRAVARELVAAGVGTDAVEAPGSHDWPLWRDVLPGHLQFHWQNVKA